MNRDAIFWLTTSDDPLNERTRVRMVGGRKIVEKHPQHGHVGDYDNKQRAPGMRYVYTIRHEGHEIAMVLTNAAAHLDPSSGYGNYVRRKARYHGWYPSGACPAQLLKAGELELDHLASIERTEDGEPVVRGLGEPCEPGTHSRAKPCRHDLAERAARKKQWNASQTERLEAFRSESERTVEETKKANDELLAGLNTQNAELLERLFAKFSPQMGLVGNKGDGGPGSVPPSKGGR